jgi:hypothetical protein
MGQLESHGGPTPANEAALQKVAELISEVQDGGGFVQKFVLMVETVDGDDRWLSSFCAPGQKAWDTMGLLQYGLSFESNFQATSDSLDDDED